MRKRDKIGNIIQWKPRLVAQGFSQKPGTDYNNDGTFAPVMHFKTLHTVLAYAAINKLKLRQFDVKGAYLNGYLNETISLFSRIIQGMLVSLKDPYMDLNRLKMFGIMNLLLFS